MKIRVFLAGIIFLTAPVSVFAFAKKPSEALSSTVKKYACPMQCSLSSKPGKCPKCGMEMWEVS